MPDLERAKEIADQLTKASKRALVRIERNWTNEGAPGPSRQDTYSLGWGRDAKWQLATSEPYAITSCGCRWRWKLTVLGAAVRRILEEKKDGN